MSDSQPVDAGTSLLATASAGKPERRLAVVVITASFLCLAAMAPFATTQLVKLTAFIPAYESALAINELITAVLLFGQFVRLRTTAVLVLASGYLLNTVLIVAHALTFPDVFSHTGLLGAKAQTSAWLYVFWHGAFPLCVLAYALLSGRPGAEARIVRGSVGRAAAVAAASVLALALALVLLATLGHDLLPRLMINSSYARMVEIGVSPALVVLTLAALAAMWRRRSAAVLDLWLIVVLCVWVCDVTMSAVIGSSRYDLGWYGGRLFGLLAGSFVLAALLLELNRLYGRLAAALRVAEARNVELVRSREELTRVQRLEAVGQLTGGIAHDFNNLLTAVMGNLEMIRRAPDNASRVVRLAENATKATQRGAQLVQQLLTFARKRRLHPEVFDPNGLLYDFEQLFRRAAGDVVAVSLDLVEGVHPVQVDAAEFQSAVLNLVANARDAMPDGGSLRISSGNVELDAAYCQANSEVNAGPYVLIAVADQGAGMDAETQARVFEPFFTTKGPGLGTGLGLSQVYGFAKSAGGHIQIQSEIGAGTTVKLFLPRTAGRPSPAPSVGSMPLRPALDGETILVVEDDPDVMTTAAESLVDLGYRVITARDAREALAILRSEPRIDILFSDVVMPGGMNGVQLSLEAQRERPDLKILLTSGYTGASLDQHGVPADLPLLGKPYRREELAEKLRLVMQN
ncbi:MAG: hybrid sensor histidine kinase/response regulator [Caulobacteraceae bacterium]|nr:hybrid sensor histidine kinase/response regulator [Caulobacteraceae bacterium]